MMTTICKQSNNQQEEKTYELYMIFLVHGLFLDKNIIKRKKEKKPNIWLDDDFSFKYICSISALPLASEVTCIWSELMYFLAVHETGILTNSQQYWTSMISRGER